LPDEVRFKYDTSSLKVVAHGAAPCSRQLKEEFMKWLPLLWEGYGMSEGFGMCVIGPDEWLAHPGSVGKPLGKFYVTIRDDDGNEAPVGTIGTVWFGNEGRSSRMSYIGNPTETNATYNEYGEGSAFDLGYVDEDGYLYIVGRRKNMLIVGGVNIYPKNIEDALLSHNAVADAYVFGEQDRDFGEVPVAIVQLHNSLEIDDLARHCRQIVGKLATPRRFIIVDELPREETGKLNQNKIRELISVN
jgi:acyl-CoA synthetase (AMP-forming)/AMP-acid ligase II